MAVLDGAEETESSCGPLARKSAWHSLQVIAGALGRMGLSGNLPWEQLVWPTF